jgi:hypothetical protein
VIAASGGDGHCAGFRRAFLLLAMAFSEAPVTLALL